MYALDNRKPSATCNPFDVALVRLALQRVDGQAALGAGGHEVRRLVHRATSP